MGLGQQPDGQTPPRSEGVHHTADGKKENRHIRKKERKKADNPREGWEEEGCGRW